MRVLVVGSGGREHALAWKLAQSPALTELHAAPGNPGIAELAECHPIRADDAEGMLGLSSSLGVDLVVVGPELPLVLGLGDALRRFGFSVFGSSAAAARIEGSKAFAKDVMASAGVPTPARLPLARPPCVVKADGLAAGKGVHVCRTQTEVDDALRALAPVGGDVVVEELLEGAEVSLFAICDGRDAVPVVSCQDFKRAFDADEGPNTGGMGAYAPVPGIGPGEAEALVSQIQRPVLAELERRGTPFVGLLYAGLMLTESGPKVLEFNGRFGDPETQAVVPLLDGDLLETLAAAAAGDLGGMRVEQAEGAAVTVVLAAERYPAAGDRGATITGVEDARAAGALVFHAGTARHGERFVTNGGRILGVTAVGTTVAEARDAAYDAVRLIDFDGMRYRSDIAAAAAAGASYAIGAERRS
ncbi:MAG TPA: phosphoribosylamine--glycine ligase [Gaiellaceae bacterium]|nr:phosphoribosylamine--glycine ligase [Gaiellaceae bacterium]